VASSSNSVDPGGSSPSINNFLYVGQQVRGGRSLRLRYARKRYVELLASLYPELAGARGLRLDVDARVYRLGKGARYPQDLAARLEREVSEEALRNLAQSSRNIRVRERLIVVQYANKYRLRLASLVYIASCPEAVYKRKPLLMASALDASGIVPPWVEAEFILRCLDELASELSPRRKAVFVNPVVALKWIEVYSKFSKEFAARFCWMPRSSWLIYKPRGD